MTTNERRKAEVARAWSTIRSYGPATASEPTPTTSAAPTSSLCRWCQNTATVQIEDPPGRAESYPACEAHAIRILEAGGKLADDADGKRAAGIIARAAVLRVRRSPIRNVKP